MVPYIKLLGMALFRASSGLGASDMQITPPGAISKPSAFAKAPSPFAGRFGLAILLAMGRPRETFPRAFA